MTRALAKRAPARATRVKKREPRVLPQGQGPLSPPKKETSASNSKGRVVPALRLRAGRILAGLERVYPDARCALHYRTPLDLYVATVLSAQCTDERVNQVTPSLFARCRVPEDYLLLGRDRLEEIIRPTGFYRNKAKSLIGGCQMLVERFGGELPRTMEELIQIPGIGRKTANVILGNAFDTPGITVDTHVQRLSARLELTAERDPVKIEFALQKLFPQRSWTQLSHLLIHHGRALCQARKPQCDRCPIRRDCPYPLGGGALVSTSKRAGPPREIQTRVNGSRSPKQVARNPALQVRPTKEAGSTQRPEGLKRNSRKD